MTTELRRLRPSDKDAVYELLSDERVVRHMLFPIFTREQAHNFAVRFQDEAPAGSPPQIVRGITLPGEDQLVGLCGLVLDGAGQGEAWYLLRPDRWGHGLMTAAVRALMNLGFERLALHRIWASCLLENPASVRVLEKLGFRREGVHRQNLRIRGSWHDSYTYAMLRTEWRT